MSAADSIKLEGISKTLKDLVKTTQTMEDKFSRMSVSFEKSSGKIKTSTKQAAQSFNEFDESVDSASTKTSKFSVAAGKVKSSTLGMLSEIKSSTLGMLGLGGGMISLVHSAFQIIQTMGHLADSMRELSTDTGNTSKAVGTLYTAWGTSLGNMQQLQSAMHALNNVGIPLGKQFTELTSLMGDLDQMTGISADTWGHFTGSLAFNFKATTQDIKDVTSAVISSGVKGQQMQVVMESISKAVEHVGYSAKDSKEMVKSLAQSISSSVGVFQKLGISAQSATQFLDKMIDPNEFQNNAQLFARLGISADDFFKSMESGKGSMDLMDKLMGNLPELASKLASIQNPFQRFNIAKQMGLPMEMVSKLAGKTKGEIQDMMKVQMEKAKGDEALKKKKEEAKANQERFNEMLEQLKMQALAPIVALVSKHLPTFIKILTSLANLANSIFTLLSPLFDLLATQLEKVAGYLIDGANEFLKAINTGNLDGFIAYLMKGFQKAVDWFVKDGIPIIWKSIKEAGKALFGMANNNKTTTAILGGGLLLKKLIDHRNATRGQSKSNPMFVQDVGESTGGFNISKLKDLFKGEGGIGGFAARAKTMLSGNQTVKAISSAGSSVASGAANVGKFAMSAMGVESLSALGPAIASAAAAAAPFIIVAAAIAGGFAAMSNAAEYFHKDQLESYEAVKDEHELLMRKARLTTDLTQAEKDRLDVLNKMKTSTEATTEEKTASFTAGAATLGIAPLIDKMFDTELTPALAKGIDNMSKTALGSFILASSPLYGSVKDLIEVGNEISDSYDVIKVRSEEGMMATFKEISRQMIAGFVHWIKNTVESFKKGWANLTKLVTEIIPNLWDSFMGAMFDGLEKLKMWWSKLDIGEMLYNALVKPLMDAYDAITNISWDKLLNSIEDALNSIWESIKGMWKSIESFFTTSTETADAEKAMLKAFQSGGLAAAASELQKGIDNNANADDLRNFYQDLIKQNEEKEARRRQTEAKTVALQTKANQISGGMAANVEKIVENTKPRTQTKDISAQMLNPFAVSQIRFF